MAEKETRKLRADDLNIIQDRLAREKTLRQGGLTARVTVHMGSCGIASGSNAVLEAALDEASRCGRSDIEVVTSGCIGFCSQEPLVTVEKLGMEPIVYRLVDGGKMRQIFARHILGDVVQVDFALARGTAAHGYSPNGDSGLEGLVPRIDQIPFFALQQSWVLRNRGLIDPVKIDDYIWRDGYKAAAKALLEMEPREIIEEVKSSGLRGRGGGGFPTGLKWEFCASAKGDIKYVLCNADEGDPGAYMDRSVMEADPHAVLEGMIIAAKAIGSHQGYIYCRAEYPLAVKTLTTAIDQARDCGLLGRDILGSGFDFDIGIYQGAGAFVCGEETALMTSIEGRRGMPRPRPPFPAISGLWKKPTILNNVETFANIPQIIIQGGEAYAAIGTESSKGTKVFALTGKVNNCGLVEVPMGTSIGQVIFDVGGGIPGGKKFKAAQLGGPSGGCIPAEHLNLPTDYEAISRVGAIMGSGGLIVMDEDTCMVDMARYFMDFCQDESCGKCTPCRVGTRRMLGILQRICKGQGRPGDIELLESLATSIKDTALCGLGQTAPNPVLSTIRYFRDEYVAHIRDHRCPAAVCSELFKSPCQHICPVGMEIPSYVALVRAGRIDDAYKVLKRTNPFPSVCGRVCGHPCQSKCRRGQLDAPVAVMNLKRFITDHARRPKVEPIPVTRMERIAVIGAGPSGLTAALELKKRGYGVTVFEEMPQAGGMLRYGIPAYRLPREVLDREIQDILDTGIDLRTNTRIGRDITMEELERDFDFIYLAVGAHKSLALGVPGEESEGVYGAVEMLRTYNAGRDITVGKRVAVIGGGNSAVDAARTALRLGAESVTIFYRRERKDMLAQESEIQAAEDEGVRIEYLVAPVEVVASNGKVSGLKLTRMNLGQFDRSGRKQPQPIPGSEFIVDVDMVVSAVGQIPDLSFLPEKGGVEMGRAGIAVDENLRTTNSRIWAGGDAVTGPAWVIDAIKAGQDAAKAIDNAIRTAKGEKPWAMPPEEEIEIPFEVDEETVEQPQAAMPEVPAEERRRDFREVELGYTLEIAMAEARRCLRCDGQVQ
jgi:NADH-quinone oxidoreductase subunit F